ncbi:restriction endonuclease [Enterococcus sp. DIV0756]|uniref:restriction endonuclease n=1 Tax=Enterococcus sp. DIV0756 TaxID=2774636 RepID=UPI003F29597B
MSISNILNIADSEGVLANRFSFALSTLLSTLYKANTVERPNRGIYKITENGLSLLNRFGENLTKKILEEQTAYKEYMRELEIRNKRTDTLQSKLHSGGSSIEVKEIENLIAIHNNEVAIELLDKVRQVKATFFEKLVVKLLISMGYSGENGNAKVTSQSNDGGIDGIINQDPLGTSTVYIQAKRYKEGNTVSRPDIQSFYGALAGVNADRGVFITTSDFSSGAQDYAKNQGIVLIDGIQLTELMMQYGLGIEEAKVYKQFRIDADYFEDE